MAARDERDVAGGFAPDAVSEDPIVQEFMERSVHLLREIVARHRVVAAPKRARMVVTPSARDLDAANEVDELTRMRANRLLARYGRTNGRGMK